VKPLLSARNLSFAYGAKQVFRNVDFDLHTGDRIALVGVNGSGKTTLLKLCAGLLKPQGSELVYEDKTLTQFKRRELAQRIALVPQEIHISVNFTVRQFVEQGRTPHLASLLGALRTEDRCAVEEAMDFANVGHLADRCFNELSGGERQRVKIALAIAQRPKLLLLDEPTQHLDIGKQQEIFAVLSRLNQSGTTILAAVHELHCAFVHFASAILVNSESSLICGTTGDVLTPHAIRGAFGVNLQELGNPWQTAPDLNLSYRN